MLGSFVASFLGGGEYGRAALGGVSIFFMSYLLAFDLQLSSIGGLLTGISLGNYVVA